MYGEDGKDHLEGWAGNDDIDGGPGDDSIAGNEGSDELNGGSGNDEISHRHLDTNSGGSPIDSERMKSDGSKDKIDCGDGTGDEVWLNTSVDGDTQVNCEILHEG